MCLNVQNSYLRWHLVPPFDSRVVPESGLCLRRPLWLAFAVPNQPGESVCLHPMDCRRSSNLPGPLQVELLLSVCWPCLYFQIAHILFCQIWIIWTEIFHAWRPCCSEKQNDSALLESGWGKNMCCFAHTEKLCWPSPPCPLSPVVLCCGV